ncbi:MAG: murein biosynthesis integral membrane protein MurJ [Thermoleophilia bacterium]|nr:murein biosynthesis integral membrane protein MurJ [Thermoleophilia bacterium]
MAGRHIVDAVPMEPTGAGTGAGHRLAGAALLIMSATTLSRVFGYAREIVAARYFGAGAEKSAFEVAFLVPSTVQMLVAQAALSAALIPIFTGLLEKDRRDEAWLVARTVFTVVTIALSIVVSLFIIFAPQIMPVFAPGYRNDPAIMADIVTMTRLLFPTVVLLAITGVVISILNSFEHFTLPAIAPILWNVVILAAIFLGYERLGIEALAWGVLLGTIIQLVVQLPWLRGRGGSLGFSLALKNRNVRRVGAMMLPVSLSLGLINLNGIVNVQFASFLGDTGVAAMIYAFRLYQLPEALFAIAVGTVLFPTLSRLAARGDPDAFRYTMTLGLRVIFFLLLPISAVFLSLSEPIVRLAYEHGMFTAGDTSRVASALFFFAFGSAFSGGSALLTRSFFSLGRPWKPTLLALANLGLNALLNWLFIYPLGLGLSGIPLATSVVSATMFMALLLLIRRELGRVDGRAILRSGASVAATSVAVAAAAYFSWRFLDASLGRALGAQFISLSTAMAGAAAVFLGIAWLTRMPELSFLKLIRRPSARTS